MEYNTANLSSLAMPIYLFLGVMGFLISASMRVDTSKSGQSQAIVGILFGNPLVGATLLLAGLLIGDKLIMFVAGGLLAAGVGQLLGYLFRARANKPRKK